MLAPFGFAQDRQDKRAHGLTDPRANGLTHLSYGMQSLSSSRLKPYGVLT
ncbi:hypothetical protein D3OALGA1CA_5557 [Olavius algarvensis associated proteobacterium Delta 3]|nr:hypothetical protein D3OALGB2SA_5113 [Olavius algarvensis associated proteobacterium Delta 3]CAB5168472.1 hypothetical protein D3OALGA1CA_5557 [Olavius algarvensis associated proteobacterium Delta 3]